MTFRANHLRQSHFRDAHLRAAGFIAGVFGESFNKKKLQIPDICFLGGFKKVPDWQNPTFLEKTHKKSDVMIIFTQLIFSQFWPLLSFFQKAFENVDQLGAKS